MSGDGRRVTFGAGGSTTPPIEGVTRLSQKCEEQGYDAVWFTDHLMGLVPNSLWSPEFTGFAQYQQNPHVYLDPFVAMSASAVSTSRIKLGTLVTEPIRRHPAVLAQTLLSVDHASKGRCIAGVGSGEAMNIEPYGLDFRQPAARLEEALQIVRLLWETDQPVDFDGRFWRLKDAVLGLAPYESGKYPPIWIAAHGPRMLGIVGKYGDGWLPYRQMDAVEYGQKLATIRQAALEHQRDPDAITAGLSVFMIVDTDHESCHRMFDSPYLKLMCLQMIPAEPFERWGGIPHPLGEHFGGVSQFVATRYGAEELRPCIDKVPRSVCEAFFPHGTPEDLAADLRPYIEQGCEHIALANVTVAADASKVKSSAALTLEVIRYLSDER